VTSGFHPSSHVLFTTIFTPNKDDDLRHDNVCCYILEVGKTAPYRSEIHSLFYFASPQHHATLMRAQ
jgi:hypothetical protein